ncbi:MAG: hypothetical protein JNL72_00575 [Flavipsychrobacter sp.]|nr:hypothetical protein [Flavipsychrobacter sp.]
MYKYLIFLSLLFPATAVSAQSKWDKSSTTNLEDECIAYLSKTYTTLDNNSKETIALCFSKEIKTKYPSKEEYDNLSNREIVRIQSTYILQCAKTSLGIELKAPEVKTEEKPTKEYLIGHWKDDDSEFYLNPDGNYSMKFEADGRQQRGVWTIDGDILTLEIDRKLFGTKEKIFKIFMFQKDQFLYQSQKTKENKTVKRID